MYGGFVGSDESSQFDKFARSKFERPQDGPKGVGHAYMDVGGRATQEQLPRMPEVISPGTASTGCSELCLTWCMAVACWSRLRFCVLVQRLLSRLHRLCWFTF